MEFHGSDLFFRDVLYVQVEPGFGTEGLLRCTTGEAGQALHMHIDLVDPPLAGPPHEAIAATPLASQEVQGGLVGGIGIHLEMQRLLVRELKIAQ